MKATIVLGLVAAEILGVGLFAIAHLVVALTETVQTAGIAAVASIVNTGLLVWGQRAAARSRAQIVSNQEEALELLEEGRDQLHQVRRVQAAKRRVTRGKGDDAFVVEVPGDLEMDP